MLTGNVFHATYKATYKSICFARGQHYNRAASVPLVEITPERVNAVAAALHWFLSGVSPVVGRPNVIKAEIVFGDKQVQVACDLL